MPRSAAVAIDAMRPSTRRSLLAVLATGVAEAVAMTANSAPCANSATTVSKAPFTPEIRRQIAKLRHGILSVHGERVWRDWRPWIADFIRYTPDRNPLCGDAGPWLICMAIQAYGDVDVETAGNMFGLPMHDGTSHRPPPRRRRRNTIATLKRVAPMYDAWLAKKKRGAP